MSKNTEQIHIAITKEQKTILEERAKEEGRSMNGHIAWLIEQDFKNKTIPVVGKITEDGKILWNERAKKWGDKYWETAEGIDQSR